MPVCANARWDMELKVDNATTSNFFTFDITVDNETISGWVTDDDGNRTELSGRCSVASPVGQREVSLMDFRFIARAIHGDVEILMGGIGFQRPDPSLKPIFLGNFIAVAPTNVLVAAAALPVGIDEGDTGTGTGTQT
jgi:hypothetical protein